MKKYLMTWYGMTDFRASLGLEQTNGPVLGALLAEDYTDVVVLGFTHPDKTEKKADEFQQKIVDIENSDSAAAREFIALFSNTAEAHNHFNQWLEKQLQDAGKKVEVHFQFVDLKHLNDTEGIYEAATQYLSAVAKSEGEKLVTLYLSPGTPVMAFVWAFAALRHPNLKKRLIASSQPSLPPEKIVLPNEWLEWHGRQIQITNADSDQYDVIFHLFGEQRMPNLLGVIQFSSRKHIFVNSAQFPSYVMKQFLGDAEHAEIAVDPYDPENVRSTILDQIAKLPGNIRIGFNLTGGTKLMYAGALSACRNVNATPFYFEAKNKIVINLNDWTKKPIVKINNVELFLKLNGDGLGVSKNGVVVEDDDFNKKVMASELIWRHRGKIASKYKELINYKDNSIAFKVWDEDFYAEYDGLGNCKISIGGDSYCFSGFTDFVEFLTGGWFEVFIYSRLKPLEDEEIIKDLRLNLEVSIKRHEENENFKFFDGRFDDKKAYQEFDVIFTDGYELYILECKSGGVNSDHIVKLHEITKRYGGVQGRGIMLSCFKPNNPITKQKSDDFKNIDWIFGAGLPEIIIQRIRKGLF